MREGSGMSRGMEFRNTMEHLGKFKKQIAIAGVCMKCELSMGRDPCAMGYSHPVKDLVFQGMEDTGNNTIRFVGKLSGR